MESSSPRTIIQALDDSIMADASLGPDLFAHLLTQQRKLGLLHGERPTCPFLRPFLGRSQYEAIAGAAHTIAEAFERLVEQALKDETLLGDLVWTALEEKVARIDRVFSCLCVSSRLDEYLSDPGFQFFEYKAEIRAGFGKKMQLEKFFLQVPPMKRFLEE